MSARVPQKAARKMKPTIDADIRRLHKAQALLIAVQFAANYEAEFDVSDALAAILVMVEQSLDGLDQVDAAS